MSGFQTYRLDAGPDPLNVAGFATHRTETEECPAQAPAAVERTLDPSPPDLQSAIGQIAGAIVFTAMFIGVAIKDVLFPVGTPPPISPSTPFVEAVFALDETAEETLTDLEAAARPSLGGKELPPRIRSSFLRIEAKSKTVDRKGATRYAAAFQRSFQ